LVFERLLSSETVAKYREASTGTKLNEKQGNIKR